jgi:hypothetical protein
LVLSPTSSIILGFTTEGRLAAVLIITFSWGFQLSVYIYITPTSTPHHHGSAERWTRLGRDRAVRTMGGGKTARRIRGVAAQG